jgi:hypothetical protein
VVEKAKPAPKPTGRPSDYSEEVAALICARIAAGESVRTICRDEDMPAMSTVFVWLAKHEGFQEQYARAREAQADAIMEDILDIADDGTNDWMERQNENGDSAGWSLNGEHVQRSKLRVDARKWMAGKLAPKKYGEKSAVELTGKDGGAIKTESETTLDLTGATLEQLQAIATLRIPATNRG